MMFGKLDTPLSSSYYKENYKFSKGKSSKYSDSNQKMKNGLVRDSLLATKKAMQKFYDVKTHNQNKSISRWEEIKILNKINNSFIRGKTEYCSPDKNRPPINSLLNRFIDRNDHEENYRRKRVGSKRQDQINLSHEPSINNISEKTQIKANMSNRNYSRNLSSFNNNISSQRSYQNSQFSSVKSQGTYFLEPIGENISYSGRKTFAVRNREGQGKTFDKLSNIPKKHEMIFYDTLRCSSLTDRNSQSRNDKTIKDLITASKSLDKSSKNLTTKSFEKTRQDYTTKSFDKTSKYLTTAKSFDKTTKDLTTASKSFDRTSLNISKQQTMPSTTSISRNTGRISRNNMRINKL